MPGPDLAVSRVIVRAGNALAVELSSGGDSVDPADLSDCLAPSCWALAGDTATPPARVPRVCRVDSDTAPASTRFELTLDDALDPAGAYLLGLTAAAHGASGQSTDTTPLPFVAPAVMGLAAQAPGVQGADVAFPLVAGPGGDLTVDNRSDALRKRLLDLPAFRKGDWTHRPDAGRTVEPKRTYSAATLKAEADSLRATIQTDPDVKSVLISVSQDGHLGRFDIAVIPIFSPQAIALPSVIFGGGPV